MYITCALNSAVLFFEARKLARAMASSVKCGSVIVGVECHSPHCPEVYITLECPKVTVYLYGLRKITACYGKYHRRKQITNPQFFADRRDETLALIYKLDRAIAGNDVVIVREHEFGSSGVLHIKNRTAQILSFGREVGIEIEIDVQTTMCLLHAFRKFAATWAEDTVVDCDEANDEEGDEDGDEEGDEAGDEASRAFGREFKGESDSESDDEEDNEDCVHTSIEIPPPELV